MTSTSVSRSRGLLAAYVATAAADTILAGLADLAGRGDRATARRARLVSKPALMPLLGAALASHPRTAGTLRRTTLVGEAFSWGGDVLLLGSGTTAFAAGAGSFGVGHLAYITGFLRQRDREQALTNRPMARAAGVLALAAGPVLTVAAARQERALGPAVAAYSMLLSGMLATSANLRPGLSATTRRATVAGAALFAASDLALGMNRFVVPERHERLRRRLDRFVMGSYTAAQLLLAVGASRS